MYCTKLDSGNKIAYPFLLIYPCRNSVEKIRVGMNNFDTHKLSSFEAWENEPYSVGICWFEALSEIVAATDCPIYILEDVYMNYKEEFDKVFCNTKRVDGRFFIINETKAI